MYSERECCEIKQGGVSLMELTVALHGQLEKLEGALGICGSEYPHKEAPEVRSLLDIIGDVRRRIEEACARIEQVDMEAMKIRDWLGR